VIGVGWQAAIFGQRNRLGLLTVAHQLAIASKLLNQRYVIPTG